jgi:hypothetical protein
MAIFFDSVLGKIRRDDLKAAITYINGLGIYATTAVANYSSLPNPTTVSGHTYIVLASQGTQWLPGSLGGTYYPAGYYYSNGSSWFYATTPYQATQAEVDAGVNTDKFLTPSTFNNASKFNNHTAPSKSTLVDADEVYGGNSATSFSLIRTVWSDVWTYINSKVGAIYAPLANPTFTGNPKNAQYTISASAIDWTSAKYFYKTLSANTTFTFSNVADGLEITLAITNTASNYTVTFPTADWGSAGAPVQRIGANTDIYGFVRINGTIYGTVRQ